MPEVSQRVPWRNGAGWTTVLAQAEVGELLEWRISVAEIERDAPFSDYAGYDRTIVAEDGAFTLEFDDGERVEVTPLAPFSFAGERAVFCRLHGSPVNAFNVMTLRGAFTHEVSVHDGEIDVSLVDVLADGPQAESPFSDFETWESHRRAFASWEALVQLRFAQNVRDERAAAACETLARLRPIAQRSDAQAKQRMLRDDMRVAFEHKLGEHVFARWKCDGFAFDPAIEEQLTEESRLYDEYTRLVAGATFHFIGEKRSATELAAFARNADRDIRREANALQWAFYEAHSDELDRIFGDLVRCRTEMAHRLGHVSYTDVAYSRLGRTEYGRQDVAAFRESIRANVVPLCERLVQRQAQALGVDAVMPWDELLFDRGPSLRPVGDMADLPRALSRALHSAHPTLGAFADFMAANGAFDLPARLGKRGGAFCSFFYSTGMPFVFANCTGTSADVTSIVHESGHAFQNYLSRSAAVLEYIVPTMEAAEVFSLGLEYLLWPHYDEFFGELASRYRRQHASTYAVMLPYVAAVDHFQEIVYDNPEASPAERHRIWLDVHERYLPYRRVDAVAHLADGGGWQRQHHIFGFPFYYIDYALALFAAFDLWRRSSDAYGDTIEMYVAAAKCGSSVPFRKMLNEYGIADPFDTQNVSRLARFLDSRPELH